MAEKKKESKPHNLGGRPRKFNESSRPITVTLPERTLTLLASVDNDRALAITKATDWVTRSKQGNVPKVEIVEVEKGRAIILVGPSKCLKRLDWLRLVEIAPARFLLVLPSGTAIETLEVAVMDMLDGLAKQDEYERELLMGLRGCLTRQRRGNKVSKAEMLLIDTSV